MYWIAAANIVIIVIYILYLIYKKEYTMEEIKVGQTVRLKSGGPDMVVVASMNTLLLCSWLITPEQQGEADLPSNAQFCWFHQEALITVS